MYRSSLAALAALLSLVPAPVSADDDAGLGPGQHARRLRVPGRAAPIDYLIYLPERYFESAEPLPVIVFLHGGGQRGGALRRILRTALPRRLETERDFPFVVLSPHCRGGTRFSPDRVIALLDHALATWHIDPDRVYLTGLSLGGFGTWNTAARYPDRFAAVVPIAAWGRAPWACALRDTPLRVYHGTADDEVSVRRGREMVDAVRACGGAVESTEYPGVRHDAWTRAYADPNLFEWLLRQRRPTRLSLAGGR